MTGRRFGIVIGTNEYSDSKIEKLEFAEKDAKDIKSVLNDPNICGFDEVIELINKSEKDTFYKIGEMFKRAEYEDLLLIYFSGHGQTDSENELCLLFNDTKSDNLIPTSLNFSMIRKCIDDSRCKTVVVILDCCYSGAAGLKGSNLTKTLEKTSGSGILILSSSSDYETSKEDKELKNGVLTHYLIKGRQCA